MRLTDQQLHTYKDQGFLIVENFLTPQERQAALDGFFRFFAPPGDPLWSEAFIQAMAERYPGFDPAPYLKARK